MADIFIIINVLMLDLIHFKPFSYLMILFHSHTRRHSSFILNFLILSFQKRFSLAPTKKLLATRKKAVTMDCSFFLHLWNSFMTSDYHNICIKCIFFMDWLLEIAAAVCEAIFKELFCGMRLFSSVRHQKQIDYNAFLLIT